MEPQRKLKVMEETLEEIRMLEEMISTQKPIRKLKGMGESCSSRKLALTDIFNQFTTKASELHLALNEAVDGSKELSKIITDANDKFTNLKSSLGLGGRRLVFD